MSVCGSETTDETGSDDSMLSLVLALVVEPPASLEKYSFVTAVAGTSVLGLISWTGLAKLTEGILSVVRGSRAAIVSVDAVWDSLPWRGREIGGSSLRYTLLVLSRSMFVGWSCKLAVLFVQKESRKTRGSESTRLVSAIVRCRISKR